jgi:hypothetical protein
MLEFEDLNNCKKYFDRNWAKWYQQIRLMTKISC